jgi:hypothetical protein
MLVCVRFIIEDQDTFFSPAQRSLLVYQLLQRCPYDNTEPKSKFGKRSAWD